MGKSLFQSWIVLDPKKSGLISDNRIKRLRIYPDRLEIGREGIQIRELVAQKLVNDCIEISTSTRRWCFGIRDADGTGASAPLNQNVAILLDAVVKQNEAAIISSLESLKELQLVGQLRNIAVVILVVLMAAAITLIGAAFIPAILVGNSSGKQLKDSDVFLAKTAVRLVICLVVAAFAWYLKTSENMAKMVLKMRKGKKASLKCFDERSSRE